MSNKQPQRINVMEQACLARIVKSHGINTLLNEISNLVPSYNTKKALQNAISEINGNVKKKPAGVVQ